MSRRVCGSCASSQDIHTLTLRQTLMFSRPSGAQDRRQKLRRGGCPILASRYFFCSLALESFVVRWWEVCAQCRMGSAVRGMKGDSAQTRFVLHYFPTEGFLFYRRSTINSLFFTLRILKENLTGSLFFSYLSVNSEWKIYLLHILML